METTPKTSLSDPCDPHAPKYYDPVEHGAKPCPVCGELPELASVFFGSGIGMRDIYHAGHELADYQGLTLEEAVSDWNRAVENCSIEQWKTHHLDFFFGEAD